MKHIHHRFYTIAFVLVAIVWLRPSSISAQLVCTGSLCTALPFSQSQLDQSYYELKNQVVSPLAENYAKASAAANIMQPMIGSLGLTGITMGTTIQTGFHDADSQDVDIPNVGYMEDVEFSAVQAFPSFFAGVNLGALLGNSYDYTDDPKKAKVPSLFSLTRFDVYLLGLKTSQSKDREDDGQIVGRGKYSVETKGFQIRYQLSYGKEILGPFLRWHGISLVAGMIDTSTSINYADTQADHMKFVMNEGNSVVWMGDFLVSKIESNVKSYPFEIHTGIQAFYFLNLTIGGGVAWNSGHTELLLTKNGRAFVESDVLSALMAPINTSTYLGANIQAEGAPPAQMYYVKAGLELNLVYLKIGAQAMATQDNNYGGNITLRFEL